MVATMLRGGDPLKEWGGTIEAHPDLLRARFMLLKGMGDAQVESFLREDPRAAQLEQAYGALMGEYQALNAAVPKIDPNLPLEQQEATLMQFRAVAMPEEQFNANYELVNALNKELKARFGNHVSVFSHPRTQQAARALTMQLGTSDFGYFTTKHDIDYLPESWPGWARGSVAQGVAATLFSLGEAGNEAIAVPAALIAGTFDIVGRFGARVHGYMRGLDDQAIEEQWDALLKPQSYTLDEKGNVVAVAGGRIGSSSIAGLVWSAFSEKGAEEWAARHEAEREFLTQEQSGMAAVTSNTARFLGFMSGFAYGGPGQMLGKGISTGGALAGGGKAFYNAWKESSRGLAILRAGGTGGPWQAARAMKIRTILGELAGGAAALGTYEAIANGRVEGYAQAWMHGALQYPVLHAAGALGRATSGVLMRKKLPAYVSRGLGATVEGTGLTLAGLPMPFGQNTPEAQALWGFLQDPSTETAKSYYDAWLPNVLGMVLWSGVTGRSALGQRQRMQEEVEASRDVQRSQASGRPIAEEQARTAMRGYAAALRQKQPWRAERREEIQWMAETKRQEDATVEAYKQGAKMLGRQAQEQGKREAVLEAWGVPIEKQGEFLRFVPRDKGDVLGRMMDFTRARADRGDMNKPRTEHFDFDKAPQGGTGDASFAREIGMLMTRTPDGVTYAQPVKGMEGAVDLNESMRKITGMIGADFGTAAARSAMTRSTTVSVHTHPTISPPSLPDLGVFFAIRGAARTGSSFVVTPSGAWVVTPKADADLKGFYEAKRNIELAGGTRRSFSWKDQVDGWITEGVQWPKDATPSLIHKVRKAVLDVVGASTGRPLEKMLRDIPDRATRELVRDGVDGYLTGMMRFASGFGLRMTFIPEAGLARAWEKTLASKDMRYHTETADLVKERGIETKTRAESFRGHLDKKKPHRELFTDVSRKHLTRVFERSFQKAMDDAQGRVDELQLREMAEGRGRHLARRTDEQNYLPQWFSSAMEPFYEAVESIGRVSITRNMPPIAILDQIGVNVTAISKRFRFTEGLRPRYSVPDRAGQVSPDASPGLREPGTSLVERRARQFLAEEMRNAGLNPNVSRVDLADTPDRWLSYRGDPVPLDIVERVESRIEATFGKREERLPFGREMQNEYVRGVAETILERSIVPPRNLGELNRMVSDAVEIPTKPMTMETPGVNVPGDFQPPARRFQDIDVNDPRSKEVAAGRDLIEKWREDQAERTRLGKDPTPKEMWERTKAGAKKLAQGIADYLIDKKRRIEVADAVRKIGYRNRNFGGFDAIAPGFENTMLANTDRVRIRIRNAPRQAMDTFGDIMRPIWEGSHTIKDPETGARGQLRSEDIAREIQQTVEYAWLKDLVSNATRVEKVPADGPEFRESLRDRSPSWLPKRVRELWAAGKMSDKDAARMSRNAAIAQGRDTGKRLGEMVQELRKTREDLEVEAADWTRIVDVPLPGGAPLRAFQDELAVYERILKPRQREAYSNMRTVLDSAFDSMVKRGAISEASRRPDYFPRHIVDYGDVFQALGPLRGGKKLPFRPYTKGRTGSTRLHEMTSEALLSYLTKVQIDNAKHDWMSTLAGDAQKHVEMRIGKSIDEIKEMDGPEWSKFFDEVVKPEGLVVFDANSGTLGRLELERDATYQQVVNEINAKLPEGMRIPDGVEVGRYWRPDSDRFRYLVPRELADWFVKAQDTGVAPFYGLLFNINRQVISPIKLAMLRGFAGVGTFGRAVRNILSDAMSDLQKGGKDYREGTADFLRKFTGDVLIPSREGDGVKLGAASHRISLALAKGDISKLSDFEQSIARELEHFGTVRSGRFTSGEEFAPSNRDLSPWLRAIYPQTPDRVRRWAKAMLLGDYDTARVVDEYAENLQRIAFFMRHRMERFEQRAGRPYHVEDEMNPQYRDAMRRLTEAAHIKTGETLVSYQWLTPVERYLLNGSLVPFYTWARGNFQGTVAAALEKPGAFAAKVGTITALSAIWNTLMAPEEEQRLASVNPSIASRFHLFIPWWKDSLGNTAMVFMLEDPALEAMDLIFGLGSAPAKVQNFLSHQDPGLLMRDLVQGGVDDWQQSVRDLAAPWLRWFGDESYQSRYMDLGERAGQMMKGGTSAFRPLTDINRLLLDSTRSNEQAIGTLAGPFLHFVDLTKGLPARQRGTDLSIGREERASATLRSDIRKNLKRYIGAVAAGDPAKTLAIMDETWERFEDRLKPLGISKLDVYARYQRARQEFERRELVKTLPTDLSPKFFEQSGTRQRRFVIQRLIEETR